MNEMPALETTRLIVRPFVMDDLTDIHRLFDLELSAVDFRTDKLHTLSPLQK
jgi:hypothetical protein